MVWCFDSSRSDHSSSSGNHVRQGHGVRQQPARRLREDGSRMTSFHTQRPPPRLFCPLVAAASHFLRPSFDQALVHSPPCVRLLSCRCRPPARGSGRRRPRASKWWLLGGGLGSNSAQCTPLLRSGGVRRAAAKGASVCGARISPARSVISSYVTSAIHWDKWPAAATAGQLVFLWSAGLPR